ncbi:hypothetical protein E4U57_007374 [Claviceps arundinis]|uniref:NCT transcriptional regulatory complex subunit A n=1 Tax=Claviceps arundinis TaxID=1623583 RepID=A0A9P7N228_9HYPO|nr:hypothetical protein E4U57_007374 [Claviceps arundinis]KAG5978027.1 hypothetical protein E4U56_005505 [Claviceps arundinis]
MTSDDGALPYAPRSPDLSSFYSSGPTQAASQLHSASPGSGQYKLHPPPYAHSSSYAPPVQFPVPQQHNTSQGLAYSPPLQSWQACAAPLDKAPYQLPARNLHGWQPPHMPPKRSHPEPSSPITERPRRSQSRSAAEASRASAQHDRDMPPRKAAPPPEEPPAPVIEPSPVKTKFPVARIKRIMQADEEVGKVAQQTPIAVGKALELFMIQMVSSSAEVAREKGSKRVTASMLKQVVETDDQWDFLREIVSRVVENEKEGCKSKAKAESDSDDDSEPKKRSKSISSRRKKT